MQVQTVLGPIGIDALGRTLIHEHLYASFAGAELDTSVPFDRPGLIEESIKRLRKLREEHGVRTFVDPCPIELGRDVEMMAEVAEKSGMNIVCTTGFYFEAMGLPIYWRFRTAEEIAAFYIREITVGIGNTGIRAGAIKAATGAPAITPLEHKFLAAASIASRETGVPIITHTQDGQCGPEQLQAFVAGGAAPHRCLIGHCCENPSHAYHRQIVDGGAYIGFDRIGVTFLQSDEVRADSLVALVRAGFGAQVMMSQDRFCGLRGKRMRTLSSEEQARTDRMQAEGTWPPPFSHLFTDFFPMLRARGMGDAEMLSILEDNPRRFFAGETLPPVGGTWRLNR